MEKVPKEEGVKHKYTSMKCLAVAKDISILTDNLKNTKVYLETLKETVEETWVQISFELITKYDVIHKTNDVKYLGKFIQNNGLNTAYYMKQRYQMEVAYHLTKKHVHL